MSASVENFIPLGIQRLQKLAHHLMHGNLGHEQFDFSVLHQSKGSDKNHCGTLGCALGECLVVFPEWSFQHVPIEFLGKRSVEPVLTFLHRQDSSNGAFEGAELFFGIDEAESEHLFQAGDQEPEKYGGELLALSATKEQVAANIRAFIAKKLESLAPASDQNKLEVFATVKPKTA